MDISLVKDIIQTGLPGILLIFLWILWVDNKETHKKLEEAQKAQTEREQRCANERLEEARKSSDMLLTAMTTIDAERKAWYERWDSEAERRENVVVEACNLSSTALTKASQALRERKGGST